MELLVPERRVRIIKSTEDKAIGTFYEEIFKECENNNDVLESFQEIERAFKANPNYELLHGARERLSISFRDIHSLQEIRFIAED
ncbi:hypothetical protein PQ465_16785 [Sphingobacterium oryzagri]|uniref:Uncharacterized protein n=1 Tax=Sphingobacterium oryzagri TaxID=3025669 RepID=A0ABY7WI29_9SPHI|nr:hypothetical protein [Sphingobacterium sp. KACC 22765]WDF67945.1 hypothetical protein PQ465_16785 [Sphingobacterium sp. KACC 22765]